MIMIKKRLHNHLADCNLFRLMRIANEGPELQLVNFNDILEVYKEKIRCIPLSTNPLSLCNVHQVYFIPSHSFSILLNGKYLGGDILGSTMQLLSVEFGDTIEIF